MSARELLTSFILSHHQMPTEKAAAIADRFTERSFTRNELILKEGQRCTEYHFLAKGFMRTWSIDLEGREVTTGFHPAGTVVCELFSFFKHVPARENIQAAANCSTLTISFNELQDAFHTLPEFREFGRSILINAYASLKQRMLSGLHDTAEQRYKTLMQASPQVFQFASLKQIASYLGVIDTSLSRIRAAFAKEAEKNTL